METKELMQLLHGQRDRFKKLDKASLLNYEQECLFARQQITANDYVFSAAAGNPGSLQAAILNVAAIGISLNPANKHAYLVPRAPKAGMAPVICLDISYRGLVKLATDSGAIKDCKSILVYADDTFKWRGPYKEPKHEADVFGQRGEVVGAYNVAYLNDGRVMCDVIDMVYISKVQNTSKAASGPWKTWWEEMVLKTATKHAAKSWPQTENRERLDRAIDALNEHEGMAYTLEQETKYKSLLRDQSAFAFWLYVKTLDQDAVSALYNSFEAGSKVKDKKAADQLEARGREEAEQHMLEYHDLLKQGDDVGAAQIRDEFTDEEWEALMAMYNAEPLKRIEA